MLSCEIQRWLARGAEAKLALRKKLAGICNVAGPLYCGWEASSASRRGSRSITLCP